MHKDVRVELASLESSEKKSLDTIVLHNLLITKRFGTGFNEIFSGDPNRQYASHLRRILGSKYCNVHFKNAPEVIQKMAAYKW